MLMARCPGLPDRTNCRSGSSAISSPAPAMKPSTTESEIYRVRSPSLNSAIAICTTPTMIGQQKHRLENLLPVRRIEKRQRTEHDQRNGVRRAVDQIRRRAENRADRRDDNGGIKAIPRIDTGDQRIGHRLRHGDRRHGQTPRSHRGAIASGRRSRLGERPEAVLVSDGASEIVDMTISIDAEATAVL